MAILAVFYTGFAQLERLTYIAELLPDKFGD